MSADRSTICLFDPVRNEPSSSFNNKSQEIRHFGEMICMYCVNTLCIFFKRAKYKIRDLFKRPTPRLVRFDGVCPDVCIHVKTLTPTGILQHSIVVAVSLLNTVCSLSPTTNDGFYEFTHSNLRISSSPSGANCSRCSPGGCSHNRRCLLNGLVWFDANFGRDDTLSAH